MKSLFPEMDKEIADDRKAEKREQVQRARDYLRKRDLRWLMNELLERGPTCEHNLMSEAMEEEYHLRDGPKRGMEVLWDLHCLWLVRKLWRQSLGVHPASGQESFLYGVRGVHALRSGKEG